MVDEKTKKNEYYNLIRKIKMFGEKTSKRHGEYFSLKMFDGNRLVLDTWNKSVVVYNNGNYKYSLGIDFGGFRCDLRMTRFWSAHIPPL